MKKVKWYKQLWDYWRPTWEGVDGKPSFRTMASISLIITVIVLSQRAFYRWEAGRSLEGAAIFVGTLIGGALAFAGIQAFNNIKNKQIDKGQPNPPVTVTNAETVNVDNTTTKSAE